MNDTTLRIPKRKTGDKIDTPDFTSLASTDQLVWIAARENPVKRTQYPLLNPGPS
jgi:hypothetical protein